MALQSLEAARRKQAPGEMDPGALARVEALWALEGMDANLSADLTRALNDSDPMVREQVVKVSADWMNQNVKRYSNRGGLNHTFDDLTIYFPSNIDPTPRVRFQIALCSEPDWGDLELADQHLGKVDIDDPWMRVAVLSAPPDHLEKIVLPILREAEKGPGLVAFADQAAEILASWVEDYSHAIPGVVAGDPPPTAEEIARRREQARFEAEVERYRALVTTLREISDTKPLVSLAGLQGFMRGLSKRGQSIAKLNSSHLHSPWLNEIADQMTQVTLKPQSTLEDRSGAIPLLALLEFPKLQPIAAKLLLPAEPDAIRVATIKLLGQQRDPKVADLLLEAWSTLTPAPREAALQVIAGRAPLISALLDAIEANRIKAAEISPTARTLLTRTTDAKLRERAAKVFGGNASRAEVIAKYQPALELKGDAEAGHKVYQTICAACHRKGEEGRDIGPNLATILNWTPDQILVNVLDPNREVVANFILYVVETNDGRTLSGLITNETASSIGLKGADGVEQTIARAEIKSLKSTGLSLMPEGLEAGITPQQMADVIEFLRR